MPRTPDRRRERLTGVQRVLLEMLRDNGPQTPGNLQRARTYAALAARGLCSEREDGSFELLQEGLAALEGKMGRPTTMRGAWLALVNHYGGPHRFSKQVGVAYSTVNRWALHQLVPGGPSRKMVHRLAKEAGLPDPFEEMEKTG